MGKKKIKQLDISNCSTGVDLQKTAQCLQSPEKLNEAEIQFTYGIRAMKETGMPVTKERIKEAETLFLQSAGQGYAPAHLSLGILYIGAYPQSHLGAIENNDKKALFHFEYAAERNISEAQYRLAMILEKTPGSLQLAVSWLVKAAVEHKGAQCRLALMYMKGNQVIEQNKARGIEMLQQVAKEDEPETLLHLGRAGAQRAGPLYHLERAEALYHLGRAYEKGDGVEKDDVQAEKLLLEAAMKKHKDALLYLATKYELGDGVSRNDAASTRLLTLAANAGYPEAQLRLAIKYEEGEVLEKDEGQALTLLTKAAEKGYKEAQFYLAIKYEEGDGVKKDEDQALALLTKAAKKGYPEAQFHLGVKCYEGRGIKKDEIQAVDWLIRAADRRHLRAKEYLCNLIEKNVCLNDIYSDVKQLIRASQSILGEKYDIVKTFRHLLPEGIPELADETFYHYTYKLFLSEEHIPAVKQPGIVYLYIKNNKFNYYILNSFSSGLGEKVYSGTLDLPPDIDLSCLKDVLQRQLIQNECIEPSYEALNLQEQYAEFLLYEKKFEAFLHNILSVLETYGLCDSIEEKEDIKTTARNLLQNQILICKKLEKEFKDSSQMIDILKEAYRITINLEDFYSMGCYMKQLDKQLEHLPAKKKILINMVFQHPRTTVAFFDSNSISEASFQAIFLAQYTISRKMLFQTLATYFRKRHPKFYELEPIFIMFEKMALVANMTHENTPLMAMPNLQIQLQEENNIFKMICFQLIQPIFDLLIMDTQQTPLSVIYKNLLEIQKPIFLEAILDLQKQMSDFKKKLDIEAEMYPNAENIEKLLKNLESTSNLTDIIGILIKVIQIIESFILEVNASKTSQGSNRHSSDDSSEYTQSLGSLQGTSEDLLSEQGLVSPKVNKRKSVRMTDELKKGRRKSIIMLSQLSSRMSRRNEGLESTTENEHEAQKSSVLLSSTIGNGSQPILADDIGLSSSNRSESDNTSCNLSTTIENGDNTEEDFATASTSSYIRDRSYSPSGMNALLSPKVTHGGSAINTALNHNGSGSQQGDITLRSSKGQGERHQSAKRNRRRTEHFSAPMELNQGLSSNSQDLIKPKKVKSLKEKWPFFHTDNTSDVRNRLSSSSKPNFANN